MEVRFSITDVPLVEFMYFAFTRMTVKVTVGDSGLFLLLLLLLLLLLSDVFRAL